MKFVFVDRDGVVNKDPQAGGKLYVASWRDFHFLPGVLEALKKLTEAGYKIVIISNQAGVSKGVYSKEELDGITEKMLGKIEAGGAKIYSVQYCIHQDKDNCDCRKPKAGLFKKATAGFSVDFSKTYFIGDSQRDIEAGRSAGCKTILVLSGRTRDADEVNDWALQPDFIKKDLSEALEIIL